MKIPEKSGVPLPEVHMYGESGTMRDVVAIMDDAVKAESAAADFCLPDTASKMHCLSDFRGKWVVLYFYPKDNTSGCTKEAIGFTEMKKEFEREDAVIIGISKEPPRSHARFIEKHELGILLLSDENHEVIEKYGAWGKKKLYGKEHWGTIRSTFIIDPPRRHREKRMAKSKGKRACRGCSGGLEESYCKTLIQGAHKCRLGRGRPADGAFGC